MDLEIIIMGAVAAGIPTVFVFQMVETFKEGRRIAVERYQKRIKETTESQTRPTVTNKERET